MNSVVSTVKINEHISDVSKHREMVTPFTDFGGPNPTKKCVITLSACLIVKIKRCIDIKRSNNYNYHVLVYPRENVLI